MMCRVGGRCAARWSRAAAFGIWCCRPSDSYPSFGVPNPTGTLPAYPVSTYPLVTAPSMYPPLSSYPSATYPPSSGLATGYVAFSDAPSQPEHGAPAPGLTQLLDRVVAAQSSDDVIVALSELSVKPELLYVVLTVNSYWGGGGRWALRIDGGVVFASTGLGRGAGMWCVCVCECCRSVRGSEQQVVAACVTLREHSPALWTTDVARTLGQALALLSTIPHESDTFSVL